MKQLKNLQICMLTILLSLAVVSCTVAEQTTHQEVLQSSTESPTATDTNMATRGYQRKITAACFGPNGDPLSPCDVEFKTQNFHFNARCITAPTGICQTFIRCCGYQGSPQQLLWNIKATSIYGQASTSFWTSCGWTCDEHKYIRFTFSADKDKADHHVEQSNVDPMTLQEWEDTEDAVELTPEEAAADTSDCTENDTRAKCRCRYKCVCVRHSGGRCEQVDVAWTSDCNNANGKCTGKCRQYRTYKPCKPSQCNGGIPNCVRRHPNCKKF